MTVTLATGGTGGHIYPALALASVLQARGHSVRFIGQAGGMEARLVPEAGYPFVGVRAGKLDRSRPDPRQGVRALLGFKDALVNLRQERPDFLVGFGGFASLPGVAAAALLGIPFALHEANSFPGLVTRTFARRAAFVAVTDEAVLSRLRGVKRGAPVGMPVREARVSKSEARAALGLPQDALVTLVMGGSQGSMVLNERVPEAYRQLSENPQHIVLHSSGMKHLETLSERVRGLAGYRVAGYLEATLAWCAADLAITRAGISTLAEAAFHGVPLIMIPLPSAAEDHQTHNARAVEAAGAGRVVPEETLKRGDLARVWGELLEPEARTKGAQAAQARSPQGAAEALAALVHEFMRHDKPVRLSQETV